MAFKNKYYRTLALVFALLLMSSMTAQGFYPQDGSIVSGSVIERANGLPVEGSRNVSLSLQNGGNLLWSQTQENTSFTNGFFNTIFVSLSPDLPFAMDLSINVDSVAELQPFFPMGPVVGEDGITHIDILSFSRETLASPINMKLQFLDGSSLLPISRLVISPSIIYIDEGGEQRLVLAEGLNFSGNVGIDVQLPAIPDQALNAFNRVLRLDIEGFVGNDQWFMSAYEIPLTFVNNGSCMELMHLLPPGSVIPVSGGGSFGCTPLAIPEDSDSDGIPNDIDNCPNIPNPDQNLT